MRVDDLPMPRGANPPPRITPSFDQRARLPSTFLDREDACATILATLSFPPGPVPRVIKHPKVLPDEIHAASAVLNSEIRVTELTLAHFQTSLIGVVNTTGVKLVGNHQLRLGTDELSPFGPMDESFLE